MNWPFAIWIGSPMPVRALWLGWHAPGSTTVSNAASQGPDLID